MYFKKNLFIALQLFDIEINELNNAHYLYESPIIFTDKNYLNDQNSEMNYNF